MLVIDSDKVKAEKVQMEGAKDTTIQILIDHPLAPTFTMRRFRIKREVILLCTHLTMSIKSMCWVKSEMRSRVS